MEKITGAKKYRRIVSLSALIALGALGINNMPIKDSGDANTKIEKTVDETENMIEMDGYIYIPMDFQSAPQPVGYTQKLVETADIYSQNNMEYKLDRIVTFYVDNVDVNKLRNSFAGYLMYGEIMNFSNQEDGKISYAIYKPIIKELSRH